MLLLTSTFFTFNVLGALNKFFFLCEEGFNFLQRFPSRDRHGWIRHLDHPHEGAR